MIFLDEGGFGIKGSGEEFDGGAGHERAGVGLVRVNVDLEFEIGVNAHKEALKGHRARPADMQAHEVAVLHLVECGLVRVHVHMGSGAYDALVQQQGSRGSDEHASGRAGDAARGADRDFKAEGGRVGAREFDLVQAAAGSEDSQVRYDPAKRAGKRDGLLRDKAALLIQLIHWRQHRALAEKRFHRFPGQMAMAHPHVDDKRARGEDAAWRILAQALVERTPDKVLDFGAMGRRGRGSHGGNGENGRNVRYYCRICGGLSQNPPASSRIVQHNAMRLRGGCCR